MQGEFSKPCRGPEGFDNLQSFLPEESPRVMASSFQLDTSAHTERHYAVTEIAEMWNLSPDKVRELFENEPGVLVLGGRTRILQREKNREALRALGSCASGAVGGRCSADMGDW